MNNKLNNIKALHILTKHKKREDFEDNKINNINEYNYYTHFYNILIYRNFQIL